MASSRWDIHGYAIVCDDGCIADASGALPRALMNDADCAARVAEVAAGFVGADKVNAVDLPMAGGEDFAYMTEAVPGAYFFLGAQKPGENTPVCHHPDFDFDDSIIPLALRMMMGLVDDRLGAG